MAPALAGQGFEYTKAAPNWLGAAFGIQEALPDLLGWGFGVAEALPDLLGRTSRFLFQKAQHRRQHLLRLFLEHVVAAVENADDLAVGGHCGQAHLHIFE